MLIAGKSLSGAAQLFPLVLRSGQAHKNEFARIPMHFCLENDTELCEALQSIRRDTDCNSRDSTSACSHMKGNKSSKKRRGANSRSNDSAALCKMRISSRQPNDT